MSNFTEIISPSYIAVTSLARSPEALEKEIEFDLCGIPLPESENEEHCVYCGVHLQTKDLACLVGKFNSYFNDNAHLANPSGKYACAACDAVTSQAALNLTGKGVFALNSPKIPFAKREDVCAALLNPPDAPFIMCYATAKNQHMVWRSPVNYSKDMYYVKVGLRSLKIRRLVLIEAVKAAHRVGKIFGLGEKKNGLNNPLQDSSPGATDINSYSFGKLRVNPERKNNKQDMLYEEKLRITEKDRNFLETHLTLGEMWALSFFLSVPNAPLKIEE